MVHTSGYLLAVSTATAVELYGPDELARVHAGFWRRSTMLNGDRWREMWNALDEETREQVKAKARWEHMTLSAVIHGWWPELAQASAVICLYQPRDNGYGGVFTVGHVDSDGRTLMRTERSWQRKYHQAKLDPDSYLVEVAPERYATLREALAQAPVACELAAA
jgi:hypothetical protein